MNVVTQTPEAGRASAGVRRQSRFLVLLSLFRKRRRAPDVWAPLSAQRLAVVNRYLGGEEVTDIHSWLAASHGFRGTADDVYRWLMVELGIGR